MDPDPTPLRGARRRFAATFRALRSRNYRLYFLGQGVSLLGTWMQTLAVTWLVYRLTNSPRLLGAVGFVGQLPTFLLASFAGVVADRMSKRRLLLATQAAAMLQALALAALTLAGGVAVWHLVALSMVLGIVNAFDAPARQSFVVDMVASREDLGNAIALNSSLFNGARLVGPSVAGLIVAAVGEGWCFALNAASFLAVLLALLAMRVREPERAAAREGLLRGWVAGLRYARSSPVIGPVLLLIAVSSAVGMPYMVLMPVFARDVFGGGPHTLGFLMGASGLGALAGALALAARTSMRGLRERIPAAGAVFSACLVGFSLSQSLALSMLLLFGVGFGFMTATASCNTLIQATASDEMRGRVMSLYSMAFMGMMPFGSLAAGLLAAWIGAEATVLASGMATMAAAALFALKLRSMPSDDRSDAPR